MSTVPTATVPKMRVRAGEKGARADDALFIVTFGCGGPVRGRWSPRRAHMIRDQPTEGFTMDRTANAHWAGDLKSGKGSLKLGSGAFEGPYSFSTRFEGAKGTNPEELLGAAHAGCFTMALSLFLTTAGHPPTSLDTKATVHLNKVGDNFAITGIDLELRGVVP